jgi:hypothetical protein
MNTPAHLIFGLAAFSKPHAKGVTIAALCGALMPDLSLYLLVGWALYVSAIPAEVVFRDLYFSDTWQAIFAVDNSVFVWGAVLAVGLWRRSAILLAFAGAALLHIAFDFPLHHDDGRPHFWPLSDWVYQSPFSYWDRGHGATWIAPLEMVVVTLLAVILWRRHVSWPARVGVVTLATAQILPTVMWTFIFSS